MDHHNVIKARMRTQELSLFEIGKNRENRETLTDAFQDLLGD